jgi:hypothetical protein
MPDPAPCALVRSAKLVDAGLAVAPALPTETPPDRRRKFTVSRVTSTGQNGQN